MNGVDSANYGEITVLEARHDALVDRLDRLERSIDGNFKRIYKKLEQMGNRPSWAILTIITFLSSLCLALFVIVAKGGFS